MATRKRFANIEFARIKDLLDFPLPETLREITYVANCTNFRRLLLNKYGKEDLDIDNEIATNPDTKLTYLGYRRFLESDLRHIFPPSTERTKNGYKRDVKFLAKQMLIRGYVSHHACIDSVGCITDRTWLQAFANAIKDRYPNHLRLSIHESFGEHKVSISLLNSHTGYTTPWHCSVALLADGTWISAPMSEFKQDSRLKLVYEDERPSYFEEIKRNETNNASFVPWENYVQTTRKFHLSASGYSTLSSNSVRSEELSSTASFGPDRSFSEHSSLSSINSTKGPYGLSESAESTPLHRNSGNQPDFGRRLIPQIMDNLASIEPGRVVFSIATQFKNSLEFRNITACEFAAAVDKTAWWLHDQLGKQDTIRPVGYIGPRE